MIYPSRLYFLSKSAIDICLILAVPFIGNNWLISSVKIPNCIQKKLENCETIVESVQYAVAYGISFEIDFLIFTFIVSMKDLYYICKLLLADFKYLVMSDFFVQN